MQYRLRDYQKKCVKFWDSNPKCAWFADMGTGKTLAALHALSVDRSRLPCLVVAPLQVARFVWPAEIDRFGFDFSYNLCWGRDKSGQLHANSDIKIVNPEFLGGVEKACRDAGKVPFRSVIVDESSLFKNPDSKRWASLRAIINKVPSRLLLTGTPMPQGPVDLWAQMNLLGDNHLGSYREFLERWFTIDPFGRARAKAGTLADVERIIAPVVRRVDAEELGRELGEVVTVDHTCKMKAGPQKHYDETEAGVIQDGGMEPYSQLRTLSSGFFYRVHWSGTRETRWISGHKLDALEEIRQECLGEPLMVVTNFRAEREEIVAQLKGECRYIDGGSTGAQNAKTIELWNEGYCPVLIVHPRAAGHGLNLQHGPGRRVVFFSLPESDELFAQTIARLHRPGQKRTVFVHRILCEDTLDQAMVGLIEKKGLTQKTLLDSLRAQTAR